MRKTPVSYKLTQNTIDRMTDACIQKRVSKSMFVEEAVTRFLDDIYWEHPTCATCKVPTCKINKRPTFYCADWVG